MKEENNPQPRVAWDLSRHIEGKVYDLNQENMNAMIRDIEELYESLEKIRNIIEDTAYFNIYTQLR